MISLAECAPCKARRLQEESEKEFKERYGMIDLNKAPLRMGWRPYLGQVTASFPASSAVPAAPTYFKNAMERLLWFGTGSAFGFPIGILANVAFKSLRRHRHEAAYFGMLTAGIGLVAALLPVEKNEILNTIVRISGALTGGAFADMALPKKSDSAAIAKA